MKKLILTLTAIFTLAIAAIGFAADGGDLNKEQRAAENFVAAFTLEAPAYNQFSNGFDDTLKAKVTEQAYDVLKKQVQERFGRLKESKFYSFQRYDNVDYVTYIGSFSKEKQCRLRNLHRQLQQRKTCKHHLCLQQRKQNDRLCFKPHAAERRTEINGKTPWAN